MAQGFSFKDGRVVLGKPLRTSAGGWIEDTGSVVVMEDFIGALATAGFATITQSGTPTTAAALSATAGGGAPAGHGGWLAGSVDNVDNEIDEIALGGVAGWLDVAAAGTSTLVMECGFVVPTALTARMYYIGFADALTGGADDDGPLSIVSGTTIVDAATNAVGFVMSSLATDADGYYYGNTNAGTQSTNGTSSGLTAVVDDYTRLRVEVDVAGNAYLFGGIHATNGRTGVPLDYIATVATAVATTSNLNPIFTAASTTTTAVEWEIDYLFGAGPA